VPERERLVARIRQLRRVAAPLPDPPLSNSSDESAQDLFRLLEARVQHLEQLVQGLQDSVHRETSRLSRRIADVEAAIQPATLGKALREDARERGL